MKAKFIFIVLALLSAVGTAKAYIPTIEADTIFKGFNSGPVSGIVFANEGRSVIVMHYNQPVEIDLETHQIVKEFEAVPNAKSSGTEMKFIKNFNYLIIEISSSLIDGKKDFVGSVIWDYNTGKIIKTMENNYFISNDEHTYMWAKTNGYIYEYDRTNFAKIDSMELKTEILYYKNTWQYPVVIPNSRKILFNVNALKFDNYGNYYSVGSFLYTWDFDTGEYKNIKFTNTSGSSDTAFSKILVTEAGKYYITASRGCVIHDINLNFLYEIKSDEWKELFGVVGGIKPILITTFGEDHALFNINTNQGRKMACLNIADKKVYKYLGFSGIGIYCRETQKLALVNSTGVVALFDDEITPVKENSKLAQSTMNYQEGTLVFETPESGKMDIVIVDCLGNTIYSHSEIYINSGENILPMPTRLCNGVYFCIVKSLSGTKTYKFMVF